MFSAIAGTDKYNICTGCLSCDTDQGSQKMKGYSQFCPVAKGAEIFNERWTPLIIREMMCGSKRFNELKHGNPMMSPSLLSQRRIGGILFNPIRQGPRRGRGSPWSLGPEMGAQPVDPRRL
jgi:hypothetical protein